MKIQVISHDPVEFTRERSNDHYVIKRNNDPAMHPFQKAREYTRALNSVKLERLFSKPFVSSLSSHLDGVYCMSKHATDLNLLISGSADGEIRSWNMGTKSCNWKVFGHSAFVRGLTFIPNEKKFFSCSDDKTVKLWSFDGYHSEAQPSPVSVFHAEYLLNSIDHKRTGNLFATAGGDSVQIWDHCRSTPVHLFNWGADNVKHVRFNQTETDILASTSTDRAIVLYDLRVGDCISKTYLQMRSNAISWNPMEPYYFSVANEDHNCYTFDMRFMQNACNIFKDHVGAVMDVDYSPTGEEVVTASYDRTLRIFDVRSGHSRDVYHTKRMQRIFCIKYSMDSKYILSGSDDGNIRLWKADASSKSGIVAPKEQNSLNYSKKLIQKYKFMPEVKRISRHRHIPKAITSATSTKRIMTESRKRKDENERVHSKVDKPYVSERSKLVISNQ